MESYPYPARPGLGVGSVISEFFIPKLETVEGPPRMLSDPDTVRSKATELPLPHYEDSKRMVLVSSGSSNGPPSPLYEDEYLTNSPTFFVDAYTKIRNLSGELFQCSGETLSRGFATDPSRIEFLSSELLKVARQLNSSADDDDRKRYAFSPSLLAPLPSFPSTRIESLKGARQVHGGVDDDDRKGLPPPLVRPRRIRRKHNEEEEIDEAEKKRKLGVAPELYCHSCGTTDTPEWRRGPDGCKSLCNACGLHYAKILRRETMIPNRQPARQTMTLNNLLN